MAQSKEQRVHEVFEKIYDNYDKMNSIISFQKHVEWRNATMKIMNVKQGQSALDVCCGTGDWSIALAKAVGNTGIVKGLDFSKNMLTIAEKKVNDQNLKQVELFHGNAMDLPFEDNTFDFVTIGFGLRNVPDYLTVLKEMSRVVKPGGMVVCLETSQPTNPFFKFFFWFYFKNIMPILGRIFARSYKEYSWLQESASTFPGMKELANMFKEAGLEKVNYKPFTGGSAAAHYGYKPKK
ncbi:MAG: ubiquinone biosynthesis methyltransferase UbiE [Bacillales bacterium]|jgi:demethylmenaquinone methyltransferase/2-methoxy-6-polyprenyl-1,4-benzoquinol methylase|nr:ubiquinone biosynthesis methyltransferase UbiE [Bacillales bacterium]